MEITTAMIKQLRDQTGAGLMDAKEALSQNEGDMTAAVDWLRLKGKAKAAGKADRAAGEGLIGPLYRQRSRCARGSQFRNRLCSKES